MKKYLYKEHNISVNKHVQLKVLTITIAPYISECKAIASLPLIGKKLYEKLKHLFVRWVVLYHVAFSVVENTFFREFLHLFNDELVKYLPRSYTTLTSWVNDFYLKKKATIKNMLQQAKSSIYILFDMWTSNNAITLLGICVYFVDATYNIRDFLILLRRLKKAYSGDNMAVVVQDVIKEFGFQHRLGYFVLDNAENNDICYTAILRSIALHLKKEDRRLRCIGHIINLCA